jgi:hypothetical protein
MSFVNVIPAEAPPASCLERALNRHRAPAFEAVAREGIVVAESLEAITKLALLRLRAWWPAA